MERGDSVFHCGQDANSSFGSFLLQQTNSSANMGAPAPINPSNDAPSPQLAVAVPDKNIMPITNVTKIMRQILPPKTKINDGAKEMVQQCVSKYISFITTKAKERCQREYRKIMQAEDLLWAMENLGLHDYIEPLSLYLHRYRFLQSDLSTHHVEPIPSRGSQGIDINGPGLGPGPPSVEIPQLTFPAPPPAPVGPDSSMDPNPNLEMFDQMDLDEFYQGLGVGSSDIASADVDPSAQFNFDGLFSERDDDMTK